MPEASTLSQSMLVNLQPVNFYLLTLGAPLMLPVHFQGSTLVPVSGPSLGLQRPDPAPGPVLEPPDSPKTLPVLLPDPLHPLLPILQYPHYIPVPGGSLGIMGRALGLGPRYWVVGGEVASSQVMRAVTRSAFLELVTDIQFL